MSVFNPFRESQILIGPQGAYILNDLKTSNVLIKDITAYIQKYVDNGKPLATFKVSKKFDVSHYRISSLFAFDYIDHPNIFPNSKAWLALAAAFKKKYPDAGSANWIRYHRSMTRMQRYQLTRFINDYLSGENAQPPMFLLSSDLMRYLHPIPVMPRSTITVEGGGDERTKNPTKKEQRRKGKKKAMFTPSRYLGRSNTAPPPPPPPPAPTQEEETVDRDEEDEVIPTMMQFTPPAPAAPSSSNEFVDMGSYRDKASQAAAVLEALVNLGDDEYDDDTASVVMVDQQEEEMEDDDNAAGAKSPMKKPSFWERVFQGYPMHEDTKRDLQLM
jgi:hypothetical protein